MHKHSWMLPPWVEASLIKFVITTKIEFSFDLLAIHIHFTCGNQVIYLDE